MWPVESVAAAAVEALQAVALLLARLNGGAAARAYVVVCVAVGRIQLPPRLRWAVARGRAGVAVGAGFHWVRLGVAGQPRRCTTTLRLPHTRQPQQTHRGEACSVCPPRHAAGARQGRQHTRGDPRRGKLRTGSRATREARQGAARPSWPSILSTDCVIFGSQEEKKSGAKNKQPAPTHPPGFFAGCSARLEIILLLSSTGMVVVLYSTTRNSTQ